jgi:hypothetical protein
VHAAAAAAAVSVVVVSGASCALVVELAADVVFGVLVAGLVVEELDPLDEHAPAMTRAMTVGAATRRVRMAPSVESACQGVVASS